MILPLIESSTVRLLRDLIDSCSAIAFGVVLPVLVVWLCLKFKNDNFNKRVELVRMAYEKNPDLDVSGFLKETETRQKSAAERLSGWLLTALILIGLGLTSIFGAIVINMRYAEEGSEGAFFLFLMIGCAVSVIGLAFLIYYITRSRSVKRLIK